MKIADELKLIVPHHIEHIIVDESHDLPPAYERFLSRSPKAIIMLGDDFQITDDRPWSKVNTQHIRKHSLNKSVRTGYTAEGIFNRVLTKYTRREVSLPFSGTGERQTNIILQSEWKIPDRPCALLSKDPWYAFILATRLSKLGRKFYIMPKTLTELHGLLPDAFNFSNKKPLRTNHYRLAASSWEKLVEKGGLIGLCEIDELFKQRGFNLEHIKSILNNSKHTIDSKTYVIGLVTESKSKEFKNVCLAPDLIKQQAKESMDDLHYSKIYVGLSRATEDIILPIEYANWLVE